MRSPRDSQVPISKGDRVEVKRPNGAYYTARVLMPPSSMQKNRVLVVYECVDEGPKRLKEYVDLSQVRPCQPFELDRCFVSGDSVDAYWEKGWRKGVVKDVLQNSRYVVGFDVDGEIKAVEIAEYFLRLHREWDDGSWVPPFTKLTPPSKEKDDIFRKVKQKVLYGKRAANAKFQKDDGVEVTSGEEGFQGSWFSAVVVEYIGNDKYLVDYTTLRADDGTPFREGAKACHIRPSPPELSPVPIFSLREVVDAWYDDGWWVGVISGVLAGSKYAVYFSQTHEELEFDHSNLRIHQDWMNGKWIIPSEKITSRQLETNSNKMDVEKKRLQPKFPKGMKVEVKSDEYGFKGSWLPAVIVDSLGKYKYLVEYLTLKTEDQDAFLREEAYTSYIRPHPPRAQHAYPYQLLDNVDAWYNDGWWIGQIVEVFTGWRYTVYFSATNEELEFKHGDLRPHQEWICGRWVIASSESS